MRQHIYKVPKSSIESYNGVELRLNISYDELETDEEMMIRVCWNRLQNQSKIKLNL